MRFQAGTVSAASARVRVPAFTAGLGRIGNILGTGQLAGVGHIRKDLAFKNGIALDGIYQVESGRIWRQNESCVSTGSILPLTFSLFIFRNR